MSKTSLKFDFCANEKDEWCIGFDPFIQVSTYVESCVHFIGGTMLITKKKIIFGLLDLVWNQNHPEFKNKIKLRIGVLKMWRIGSGLSKF